LSCVRLPFYFEGGEVFLHRFRRGRVLPIVGGESSGHGSSSTSFFMLWIFSTCLVREFTGRPVLGSMSYSSLSSFWTAVMVALSVCRCLAVRVGVAFGAFFFCFVDAVMSASILASLSAFFRGAFGIVKLSCFEEVFKAGTELEHGVAEGFSFFERGPGGEGGEDVVGAVSARPWALLIWLMSGVNGCFVAKVSDVTDSTQQQLGPAKREVMEGVTGTLYKNQ